MISLPANKIALFSDEVLQDSNAFASGRGRCVGGIDAPPSEKVVIPREYSPLPSLPLALARFGIGATLVNLSWWATSMPAVETEVEVSFSPLAHRYTLED